MSNLIDLLRRRIAIVLFNIESSRFGNNAIPLDRLLFLRRFSSQEPDIFTKPFYEIQSTGDLLNNSYLASILKNDELGKWALSADVINFLELKIQIKRPQAILEFGCGISTLCFARFMQELHEQDDKLRVISIEQDIEYAQLAETRLKALKLDHVVRIIIAPLQVLVIDGAEIECYGITQDIASFFDRVPDFVVIDGPAGKSGVRYGTIPLVRNYLKNGTSFYLDDALRDGELQIADRWSGLGYLTISGIYLRGKGLLSGRVYNQ